MNRALLYKRVLLAVLFGGIFLAPSLSLAQTTPTFTRPLSIGSKGSDVSALQTILKNKSYFTYPTITDYFGAFTQAAVKLFQHANNLEQVGSVGPLTRSLLNAYLATPSSTGAGTATTPATTTPTTPPTFNTTPLPGYAPGQIIFGGGSAPTPADVTAPVISSITTTQVSSTTQTITWTTNEPASTRVAYGVTTSYASTTALDPTLATSHTVTISALTASTTYNFQVISADAAGNSAVSGNQIFTSAQYNYYVDSVNGNDINSGASPAFALKNITALPTIKAGQSVALANGSQWRQQLTISGADNVTVTGYGTGALPILNGSDIQPNVTFTKTAGLTSVYNTPLTTFVDASNGAWSNVWENGVFLSNQTSTSSVDSTACSYYIPGMTSSVMPSSAIIYIHSCDGTSPIANNYTYEVAQRTGLSMSSRNGRVLNIEGRNNADNSGSINLFTDGYSYFVSGVVARNGAKHNMFVSGGSTVVNSTFINAYYPANPGPLVFFDGVGTGLPIVVNNNVFQQDQLIANNGPLSPVLSHTTSGSLGAITMNGNWFIAKNGTNMVGVNFANTGTITADSNFGSQMAQAFTLQTNLTLTNSQFVSDFHLNSPIQPAANNLSVSISNSKLCSSDVASGIIRIQNTGGTYSFSNNLFYLKSPSANSNAIVRDVGQTGISFAFNGNDFGSNVQFFKPLQDAGSGNTFTGDNNIYESISFPPQWVINSGGTLSTLAAWKTAVSPQDANATSTGNGAIGACTLPTIPTVS